MSEGSNKKHYLKAGMSALVLIVVFIAGLEYYWRSKGYQLSYNDDKMLWASERRKVYEQADCSTVFVATSRIKYDTDIETWEKLTGEKAVQLAIVGTPPRKILLDLANDERSAGKVIMDVMEPSLFALDTIRSERLATETASKHHDIYE